MDGQAQLRLSVEAFTLAARYEVRYGWVCTVTFRRLGQDWAQAEQATFDGLTTDELVDALEASVASALLR